MTEMGSHTFLLITFSAFVRNTPRRQKKLSSSLSCLSPHLKRKKEKQENARSSSLPCLSPHLKRKKRKARKKLAPHLYLALVLTTNAKKEKHEKARPSSLSCLSSHLKRKKEKQEKSSPLYPHILLSPKIGCFTGFRLLFSMSESASSIVTSRRSFPIS